MKTLTTKQLQRMEKKTKKMSALLEIIKLNDKDRKAKTPALRQAVLETSSTNNSNIANDTTNEENPNRKRSCNVLNTLNDTPLENNGIHKEAESTMEMDNNKKPKLSGDDYIKLKQKLRERKKKLQTKPRLSLKTIGENASLNVNINNECRVPIFLSDVQHLLLYSLLGQKSPYTPTRWCHVEKCNRVTHTVVFVIEGLSFYHFLAYESIFPDITNNLKHRLELMTPTAYGGSVIEELAAVPLTGTQSGKLIKRFGSLETALQHVDIIKILDSVFPMHTHTSSNESDTNTELPSTDKFPRTQLLLSLRQMMEENYPIPLNGQLAKRYGNYIFTKEKYVVVTAKSPMFGLDCEMCKTSTGQLELTRISLVDEKMNIIYESLVKPDNPIIDYLTRYSGITKEMLENITTTLTDVQDSLKNLLPADAILVGQSLNADLHALKMMHPYIIDTSIIFNITGDRYRKTKLQVLAREFLGEQIQESKSGHCSVEDSKASMKLAQLKLANSIDYGDAVLLGQCEMDVLKTKVDKQKVECNKKLQTFKYATTIFNYVTKEKNSSAVIGNEEIINTYTTYLKNSTLSVVKDEQFDITNQVRLVTVDSNKDAVKRACEVALEHALTICHIKVVEEQLKNEKIEETFCSINKWIHKLWQHIAVNGLACVIFGGQANTANGACFLNIKQDMICA